MGYILDQQYQNSVNNAQGLRSSSGVLQLAQKFKPSVSGDIGKVALLMSKYGAPTGVCWVEIRANNAGQPGTLIKQSIELLDIATLPVWTTTIEKEFTFASGGALVAENDYWIVLNGNNAIISGNFAWWCVRSDGNYSRGAGYYNNASTYLILGTNYDFHFKEYYQVNAYLPKIINVI